MNYQYIMYMKKQTLLPALLASMLAGAAIGCSNELPQSAPPAPEDGRIAVTATAGMPQGGPNTRLSFDETSDPSKLLITWKESDESFSVLKAAGGSPATFVQTGIDPQDSHQATFEGMITDKEGDFYAFYPALPGNVTSAVATALTLNMDGQSGDALDESKVYMYGKTEYNAESGLAFSFHHLTCILQVTLNFPTTGTGGTVDMSKENLTRTSTTGSVTGVTLLGTGISSSAQVNLTGSDPVYSNRTPGILQLSGSFTPQADGAYKVYLHLLPGEISNLRITAEKDGKTYTGTVLSENRTLAAGSMYTQAVEMQAPAEFNNDVANGSGEEPRLLDASNATNSADNPYLIASPANLRWLVKQLEDTGVSMNVEDNPTTGKFYRLTTDITVTADTWTPIGNGYSLSQCFNGYFDGNGHIISGKLTNNASKNFGFFGFCYLDSEISNLCVAAATSESNESSRSIGSVAGESRGGITGCTNNGTITSSKATYLGGIVGQCYDISDCVNAGSVVGINNTYVGGVAGMCGNCTRCSNSAEVIATANTSYMGGIIGVITIDFNPNSKTITVENCTNTGKISGGAELTGGIIGYISTSISTTFTNCINTGDVEGGTGNNSYTGGIAAISTGENDKFHLCHNSGAITPADNDMGKYIYIGGICGNIVLWNGTTRRGFVYDCCTNTGSPARFVGNLQGEGAPDKCPDSH